MKRILRLSVCSGLLIFFGVSCQSISTKILTPSVTPEIPTNWWTTWLASPTCQPPCWQNITPGITTRDDAVSILENSPEFTDISKSEYGVSWVFYRNEDEGGTLSISQNGIANVIWIGSVSDKKLLVKTLVASYSYPEYVKPYDCRESMCSVLLIYPDLGIFLNVYVENIGTTSTPQFEVLANTYVNRVYFFEPGMENFQKLSFQDYDLLIEWKGYGEYP